MASGRHPAGHRPLSATDRVDLLPDLRRCGPDRQRGHRPVAGRVVRDQVRPRAGPQQGRSGRRGRRPPGQDQAGAGLGGQPRPRQDHPFVPRDRRRRHPDQLLPARSGHDRPQAAAPQDPRSAAAAARVRDLRLLSAGRGCAPEVRLGGPRWVALVGPGGGLPHRDPGPGQGADGEEHRDRPGRSQGWLLLQAAARSGGRPGGVAGRGQGLLPAVHRQPAGAHRQHRRRRSGAARARGALRRRRPLPGGGGRQGHGDVLRHRQRHLHRPRLLAGRRVRLRWFGRLRPQGDGHHRPRGVGVGPPTLPGAGDRHPDPGLHLRRDRRHERRRVRQRHAAQPAHQAGGRLRPPAPDHRPRSRPGARAGPSGSGCSTCPAPAGPTTTPA